MFTSCDSNTVANTVHTALERSAGVLGVGRAPKDLVSGLVGPMSQRLPARGLFAGQIVAPLPAVLSSVLTVVGRITTSNSAAPPAQTRVTDENAQLYSVALNLLCTSMRRETALQVTAQHGRILEQLSLRDLRVINSLTRDRSEVWLNRCELRFETVHNHKVIPRRIRLVDDATSTGVAPFSASIPATLSIADAESLERAGLVVWVDSTIAPPNNLRFISAWKHLRLGTVSFPEGFRRWLAGQHMAPVRHEDRQPLGGDLVGGIEILFRTLELTEAGRTWVRVTRQTAANALRNGGRQPFNQRPF